MRGRHKTESLIGQCKQCLDWMKLDVISVIINVLVDGGLFVGADLLNLLNCWLKMVNANRFYEFGRNV